MQKVLTPHEAEALLATRNNVNRPLVSGRSESLAQEILDGRYQFNGDTVRFDWDGNLLDGQHRLWAIVLAGKPIEVLLVFGLDPEVFDTIDIGARRTAGDTASRLGVNVHAREVASTAQYLIRWRRGDFNNSNRLQKVSNTDIKIFLRQNPGIEAAVEQCYSARKVIPTGLLAALVYEIAQRRPELADRLVTALVEPGGFATNDPFFLIRDYALNVKRDGKMKPVETLARAIKAANLAAAGKRAKGLLWRRQGRNAEPFPQLKLG